MDENLELPYFASLKLPAGAVIRRKETFEYTTLDNTYDVELFEDVEGKYYAIGVPREGRMVVYGSNVMPSASMALQIVVDKIDRENVDRPRTSPKDVPETPEDETPEIETP